MIILLVHPIYVDFKMKYKHEGEKLPISIAYYFNVFSLFVCLVFFALLQ